ncbi:MAG: fumarylacetoacetate hydrolase family protein [Proteobacteria bacterium]|nr:fumarylacetoacetate hydrolase family protein [Pseudomonadota bacterium]
MNHGLPHTIATMIATPDLGAIAREVKAAQDSGGPLEPFTSRHGGIDDAQAYAVAGLVHAARLAEGAVPVGRKIGFTNPEMWDLYGVRAPVWAYVYASTVEFLADSRGSCRLGHFAAPRIEPEIVVHFHTAPPVGADAAALLACIDWIAHGFEVVQSHYPDWKFRAADTIADAGMHARLLVGEPQPVGKLGATVLSDLERFTLSLSCNGEVREQGKGTNVLGSPLKAVAHLIGVLANQPDSRPLQAGELMTTGTITAAPYINAGEAWTTAIEGIALPGLALKLEA